VPQADVQRAREIVTRALAHAPRPVLDAEATLNVLPNPGLPRPNLVSLRVDLNGLPVSAFASAASMPEAATQAAARLRARMECMTRYWQTRRNKSRAPAAIGQARHGGS
jgi:hypothetical protein